MERDESDERVRRQVADYYRNYSKTENLRKYFSDDPLAYLPPHAAPESDKSPPSQGSAKSPTDVEPVERDNSTPVSDKKLEWDSGADIGYQNYQSKPNLFKSTSLPTLRDVKRIKVCTDFLKVVDCRCDPSKLEVQRDADDGPTSKSSSSSQTPSASNVAVKSSGSSSSEPSLSKVSAKSSSGSSNEPSRGNVSSGAFSASKSDDRDVRQFKATLEYLRGKIGLPVSNSTPKSISDGVVSARDMRTSADITPVCSDPRRVELVLTKPVTMEVEGAQADDGATQTDRNVSDKSVNVAAVKLDKATSVSGPGTSPKVAEGTLTLEEVEKMIARLRKFVKSERHDSDERKRRVREILNGLKYLDGSSGSSELFSFGKKASSGSSDVSASYQTSSSGNWRDKETRSEKRLRQIVRSERAWLDEKNSHLTKLKEVLEDFGGGRARRSRYKVRGGAGERDYVIETELGAPDLGHARFDVDGQSYSVSSTGSKASEPVSGGIEVETRGGTTWIKVKTFCRGCKRSACRCEGGGALAEKYAAVVGRPVEGTDSSEDRPARNSFEAAFDSCTCRSKCTFLDKFLERFGQYGVPNGRSYHHPAPPKHSNHVAVESEATAPLNRDVAHSEAQTETDVKDVSVQATNGREGDEYQLPPIEINLPDRKDVAVGTEHEPRSDPGKDRAKFCVDVPVPKSGNTRGAAHACKDLKYCECGGRGPGMRYTLTLRDDVERKKTKERENHRKKDVIVLEKWKADADCGPKRGGHDRPLTLAASIRRSIGISTQDVVRFTTAEGGVEGGG
ncbi:uncharacterized protein LOC132703562 isoform X2 [Cylas formicarius]|uniref:uncharacterized protein LOC132703562 isoform X2 n=1 Tax=Cylas formicarius TaxID=197179 RepID=UPI0029583DDD|nr:uncharacterized protein LOC132703562 isoform X2 [Cylas formicarius]